MKDSEINQAVAECCGWDLVGPEPRFNDVLFGRNESIRQSATPQARRPIPDFATSRDAMASALETLSELDRIAYMMKLGIEQGKGSRAIDDLLWADIYELITAKPRQQAIAFLKAKGKWRDA